MDFMNLNQAARRPGAALSRLAWVCRAKLSLGSGRTKGSTGNWEVGCAARSAPSFARELKVVRFGDNMRQVAVTEGDKVEAQIEARLAGQHLAGG